MATDTNCLSGLQADRSALFGRGADCALKMAILRSLNIDSENELFNMFVKRVKNLEGGWVDVIPYNDNLIFFRMFV